MSGAYCQIKSLTEGRGGLVVNPRTPDPEVGGSSPPRVAMLCT